jgi:hypothetical protein
MRARLRGFAEPLVSSNADASRPKTARNGLHVHALDGGRSRVSIEATLEARGIAGRLAHLLLHLQLAASGRSFSPTWRTTASTASRHRGNGEAERSDSRLVSGPVQPDGRYHGQLVNPPRHAGGAIQRKLRHRGRSSRGRGAGARA